MNNLLMHPGIILILAGILAALLPDLPRRAVMTAGPAAALIVMLSRPYGTEMNLPFLNGVVLMPVSVDALSYVFGMIFSMMALIGSIYALHNKGLTGRMEAAASLCYAGSALGVTLAGDYITLIFFWELMAVSSLFLIWANRSERSIRAGFRYLLVHMLGGNLLLIGIVFKVSGGALLVGNLAGVCDAAFWLILLGVSINAAIPPLSAWLTDAYPEANVTGSVFLSSFTTKVAVYCMIRLFAGTGFLIWFGVVMALYGALFAIIENNVRRLLSYHIISQVGFMIAAVGIGTPLALNGATAHAFSHILYKSLLFMGAGAVITATGIQKINQLGGLAKKMPYTCLMFTVGAFSIAGVPLFNGFISKSITLSAAEAAGYPIVELLLLLASVGTFLSIVMKMIYFIFFGEDRDIEVKPIPLNMKAAMAIGAFLCVLYGVYPDLLYRFLPFAMEYHPFTWDHITQYIELLAMAVIPFMMYLDHMEPHSMLSLDTDWFYRKPFAAFVRGVSALCVTVQLGLGDFFRGIYRSARKASLNPGALLGEDDTDALPCKEADLQFAEAQLLSSRELGHSAEVQDMELYDSDKAREPVGDIMIVVIFALIGIVAYLAIQ